MKESILYAVKVGEPDYMEQVITTKPEHFAAAAEWARQNGFDRIRIAVIDLAEKPDFTQTINY
jgi:hypothetical protein